MHILVCNAGSSSLKFSLFEAEGELLLAEGGIDWSSTPTQLIVRCTGQPEAREELTLQHHADAVLARGIRAVEGDLMAVYLDRAAVRPQDTGQEFDQGRFASAAFADDGVDGAAPGGKAHTFEHGDAAKALGDVADRDQRI